MPSPLDPRYTALATLRAELDDLAASRSTADPDTWRAARAALVSKLEDARRDFGSRVAVTELPRDVPALLLPVRLETRYAWTDASGEVFWTWATGRSSALLVRITPDELHVDNHEPQLTPAEADAGVTYLKAARAAGDRTAHVEAFETLVRVVGPRRAAYVAGAVGRRTRGVRPRVPEPATARLLPDHFEVRVQVQDAPAPIVVTTDLVAERVVVTPDAALHAVAPPPGTLPAELAWMTDFGEAVRRGLGAVVPLGTASHPRIASVVATGLRSTAGPEQAAAELEQLLTAHRFSVGLAMPAPGTPTNHTGHESPPPSGDDAVDPAVLFAREVTLDPPSTVTLVAGPSSDGRRLAELLGIDAEVFGHAVGADATTRALARDVRRLMRLAWAPLLANLLDPAVDPGLLAELLDLHTSTVCGVGPAPLLQVGRQPYGVLPVSLWGVDADLQGAERVVADHLGTVTDAVLAAPPPALTGYGEMRADTETSLLDLLLRDGVPQRLLLQAVLGPRTTGEYVGGTTAGSPVDSFDSWTSATQALLDPTGAGTTAPAAQTAPVAGALPVTAPWVLPASGTAAAAAARVSFPPDAPAGPVGGGLRRLAALDPDLDLPVTVLTALGRLAVLAAVDPHRWQHLVSVGDALPGDADPLAAEWNSSSLADWLSYYVDRLPTTPSPLREVRGLLATLSAAVDQPGGARTVEAILAAELSTASHRFDAWWTALATARLQRARTRRPSGVLVGAYGVVEHLRPAGTRSDGYVHAPSVAQAVAAAVLQSAHLGQRRAPGARGDVYAVDLGSARTRGAMQLIEGLRAEQPLGALLGARLEEAILDAAPSAVTGRRIVDLVRRAYPLTAGRLHPTRTTATAVAAPGVCDGLAALDGPTPRGAAPGDHRILAAARARVADLVDALGDLALSEGVHQLAQQNTARAGAAVEALAGTEVPMPVPEVVDQPSPGVAVTHRVLLLAAPPAVAGQGAGPRARLAPGLEAWAGASLASVSVVAVDATGRTSSRTLPGLMTAARLGALDVVALAGPESWPHLLVRLRSGAGASVVDVTGTAGLAAVAGAIREVLAAGRPVRASDAAPVTMVETAAAAVSGWEGDLRAAVAALAAASDGGGRGTAPDRAALLSALEGADAVGSPVHWAPSDDDAVLAAAAATARAVLAARPVGEATIGDDASAAEALRVLSAGTAWRGSAVTVTAPQEPAGADGAAVDRFLFQHAQVRDGVAAVQRVRDVLDLLGAPRPTVTVHQEPSEQGETWVALPGRPSAGRVASVVVGAGALRDGSPASAMVVDEWIEVVPDAEITTALAFHVEAPTAEAPNVALLAVPDPGTESPWSDLAAYVDEALRIARLRCVTPAEMAGNAVLPATTSVQHADPGWTPDLPVDALTRAGGVP